MVLKSKLHNLADYYLQYFHKNEILNKMHATDPSLLPHPPTSKYFNVLFSLEQQRKELRDISSYSRASNNVVYP